MTPRWPRFAALLARLRARRAQPEPTFPHVMASPSVENLRARLAAAVEEGSLPEVLSCLQEEDEAVSRAAVQAAAQLLEDLLERVPVTQLVRLDEHMRQRSPWRGGWWNLGPQALAGFDRFGASEPALIRLASMHPSGFVREEAVRTIAARGDATAIPFLLLRRNDWVEPVREVAATALDRFTTPAHAHALVAVLPEIDRLKTRARGAHAVYVESVHALLRQPEVEPALAAGLRSSDRQVRRACFSLALSTPGTLRARTLDAGMADADPDVRLAAARQIAAHPEPASALAPWLDRMELDPYPRVRRVGLDARVERFPGDAPAAFERHLLDRNASIRGQAQRGLARVNRAPAALYRDALVRGSREALDVAVLGLSEVGDAEDLPRIRPLLDDPRSRVRAAAVRAVARLDRGDHLEPMLYAALQDRSSRVSREARNAFVARRALPELQQLERILQDSPHRHVRRHAAHAAEALDRWPRLLLLLQACVCGDAWVSSIAVMRLPRWLDHSNRGVLSPQPDEIREASRRLERARWHLPRSLYVELDFLLRTRAGEDGG